jgi:hypothetical protein
MLLLHISFYQKSILRNNFLVLYIYHLSLYVPSLYIYHLSLYLRGQGCEHSWLFFEDKRGAKPRKLEKHCLGERGDTGN